MTRKSNDPVLDLMIRAQRLGFDVVEVIYENRDNYVRYDVYTPDGAIVLRHTTLDMAEEFVASATLCVYHLEVCAHGSSWPVDVYVTVWTDSHMDVHTIARYVDLWGREHMFHRINLHNRDLHVFHLVKTDENADEVRYR